MAKDEVIELEGVILESLPNATFNVEVTFPTRKAIPKPSDEGDPSAAPVVEQAPKHVILCHISGKMRKHFIRIIAGDRVTVQLSPYDLTRGRITFRHK